MLRVGFGRSTLGPRAIQTGSGEPPPPASYCEIDGLYRLDAPEADLLLLGFSGRLTLSNNDQTGTYTVQSGLGATAAYATAPADFLTMTSETLAFGSGKKAIEIVFAAPSMTGGAGDKLMLRALVASPAFATVMQADVFAEGDGTWLLQVTGQGGVVYGPTATASGSLMITAQFDAVAGTMIVKKDGVALVLTDDTYSAGDKIFSSQVHELTGVDAGDAGKTASVRLITDAASMLYVDATYTDPCGNPA